MCHIDKAVQSFVVAHGNEEEGLPVASAVATRYMSLK